jgi:hypothetical protein
MNRGGRCGFVRRGFRGVRVECGAGRADALRIGLSLIESVACGKFATDAAAARSLGLSAEMGHQYRVLARLEVDLQQEVLKGRVDEHAVRQLFVVASL